MASPHIMRSPPTCLSCLRRIAQPVPSPLSFTQTRGAAKALTKAELEDLKGIPVRLLKDIPSFGRKDALIRVKAGRMRNYWFPKNFAEYLTRQRFQELGLTMANVGVRDRTFGLKLVVEKNKEGKTVLAEQIPSVSKKNVLTLPARESANLLEALLEPTLTFFRKPIESQTPAPAPEEKKPAVPRSPALAMNAESSIEELNNAAELAAQQEEKPAPSTAIFGSVSTNDILAVIKERLQADENGNRVGLEAESLKIRGEGLLEAGEDRVKNLGTYQLEIVPGKGLPPIHRTILVSPEP